jgi:replicative DNA helicase
MEASSKLKLSDDYFETIILFKTLTDEIYLASIVEHLKPEYFKDKNKQQIIQIICEFYKKRNTIPTVPEIKSYLTSADLKRAFKIIVEEFADFKSPLNQEELYQNTEQFLKEKAVYVTLLNSAEEISKDKADVSKILQEMEEACSISLISDVGFDYFNKIDEHIAEINKPQQHISSGWSFLDKKLGGGFLADGRALYIFAGQTNIGKSIFLGNIAANVANQGKTVSIVSLEMPEQQYARRISAKLTQIPTKEFGKSSSELKSKLNVYRTANPQSRLIIKEFPPSTITPIQLNAYYKKLIQIVGHVDLFVLDYMPLLTTTVGNNSFEKGKFIAEQVRALTYIHKAPLVSATQIGRQAYNTDEAPGTEATSESMGVPVTSDAMFSLWQNDEDAELGIINMTCTKNRFGENFGNCIMRINYPTLTVIEDSPTSETNEAEDTIKTLSILSNT